MSKTAEIKLFSPRMETPLQAKEKTDSISGMVQEKGSRRFLSSIKEFIKTNIKRAGEAFKGKRRSSCTGIHLPEDKCRSRRCRVRKPIMYQASSQVSTAEKIKTFPSRRSIQANNPEEIAA